MSKKVWTKGQKTARFWLGLAIFAEIFLIATVFGLVEVWKFIEAYEASRPKNAIEAYMEEATADYLATLDPATVAQADHNLQSEEACLEVIRDSIGTVSYAKNMKLTTETEMVYMILSSGKNIGKVTMTVVDTDIYGFTYWDVTREEYDFSDLVGGTVSVTVPEEFKVYADGVLLDDGYVTQRDIPYESAKEYYKDYDLPTKTTYTAGPILGTPVLTVTDAEGNPVTIDETTDLEKYLQNCSQEELDAVKTFTKNYVKAYMNFTSVTGGQGSMQRNLSKLKGYMVSGSKLAQRMEEAVVGLLWVTDRNAALNRVDIHRTLRLEEGRYVCDLTYVVDTRDFSGKVQSSTTITLVLVETDDGLKAESMTTHSE